MNNKAKFNPPVFYTASFLIFLLVGYAAIAQKEASEFFKAIQNVIITNGSWFYVLSVATILILVVFLAFSRYGEIKLGLDHTEPDYTNISWFAMLFSAGMGIGLMFFGVAEPVMHYLNPPVGSGETIGAAKNAMRITFFHWGLHAWAIYAIVAIVLAFFSYRHDLPLSLRSALYPIIGEKIHGPLGHGVDIFAVIGTTLGVATSLGYGVLQVNSGLHHLWDVAISTENQVILIISITALATLSVSTGLDKGIKILSETNIAFALLLLIFVLILGNTVDLLQTFIQNSGNYLSHILEATFNLYAYNKTDWLGGWTILYWAWWLSWSPFVGLFIARISKGRTIREFVFGVLFVPTGFTFMWMTFFGNSAIDLISNQNFSELGVMVSKDVSVALYVFLEHFPFSTALAFIATLMVVIFFVTSADSGAMVVDMLCSNGQDNTPIWQRMYWSIGIGVIASVLLLAGGLEALQTVTIISALPFTMVLLAACYGLIKALRIDLAKKESLQYSALQVGLKRGADWRARLHNLVDFPTKRRVTRFLQKTVKPAMNDIAEELKEEDFIVSINEENNTIILNVVLGEEADFVYEVQTSSSIKPNFSSEEEINEEELYYRAEVHLREGGQNYDIMGWSQESIRDDIIDQYHKHLYFLHMLS